MSGRRSTLPSAPRHLSKPSRMLFRSILEAFELEDHHVAVLTAALEARDRMIGARELVDAEGLAVLDRFGQRRAHPLIAVERDARMSFLRGIRELGLDLADTDAARPPRVGGRR